MPMLSTKEIIWFNNVKDGHIIAEDNPKELMSATGNPNATLEDSFIYFNSKGSNNDSN